MKRNEEDEKNAQKRPSRPPSTFFKSDEVEAQKVRQKAQFVTALSMVLGLGFVFFILSSLCLAEGVSFQVFGSPSEKGQAYSVLELKQKAVQNYVRSKAPSAYTELEPELTIEFTDGFILDYRINHRDGREIELTGHLDGAALMRWIRLHQTKSHGGTTVKPALAISSEIEGLHLSPGTTSLQLKDKTVAQVLNNLTSESFQRFNINIVPLQNERFSFPRPINRESDIGRIREYGLTQHYNCLLWLHLAACAKCGGARFYLYFYNLVQDRIAISRKHDVTITPKQFSDSNVWKKEINEVFSQFDDDLKEIISNGLLFSYVHRLTIEQIDSYQAFQSLNKEISSPEFITKASLKFSEHWRVTYEIFSPLKTEILAQQLKNIPFRGFLLEPLRVNSNAIIMRYLKQ